MTQTIAILLVVIVILVALQASLIVVQQYEQVVLFRLGRTGSDLVRRPGLRFRIPVIDHAARVDMREKLVDAPVVAVTKDGVETTLNCRYRWKITDPLKSVVSVRSIPEAVSVVLLETVRGEVATRSLGDVRADPQGVAEAVRGQLDERLRQWGAAAVSVEVLDATP